MATDFGEQWGGGGDLVIALTPTQLGVVLAIAIILIAWLRARRRHAS